MKLQRWLIPKLRRLSLYFPAHSEAVNRIKVKRGVYKCPKCQKKLKRKEIQVDHITPVIPLEGFDSWDGLINRLFCDSNELKALCKSCHHIKTQKENKKRKK